MTRTPLLGAALFGLAAASCAAEPADSGVDQGTLELADDACTTAGSGEPSVFLGQGRSGYTDLEDDEPVAVEAGPQGGHHVWLALRTLGLRQAGAVVSIRGEVAALAIDVPPDESVVTLHPAEEGMCEIFGLRFQVDRTAALDTLVGQRLDLEASVTDESGDEGLATKSVMIAR